MTENHTTTAPTPAIFKEGLGTRKLEAMLNGPEKEAIACRMVMSGQLTLDEAMSGLSTNEAITVALAFRRDDLLPAGNSDLGVCWRQLNNYQRHLVDRVACNIWAFNYTPPPKG